MTPLPMFLPSRLHLLKHTPAVSSASGYLGYTLLLVLLLVYSRAGWYAMETTVFDDFPIMKPYSSLFLVVWFIPILGFSHPLLFRRQGGIVRVGYCGRGICSYSDDDFVLLHYSIWVPPATQEVCPRNLQDNGVESSIVSFFRRGL